MVAALKEIGVHLQHLLGIVGHRLHPEAALICKAVGEEARLDIVSEGVSCGLAFQMLGSEVWDSE
jgi:hypothetical protein